MTWDYLYFRIFARLVLLAMSKSSFRSREEIRLEIERLEKKLANRKKKAELKEKRLHKISESNKVLQQKNLETKTEVVLDKSVGFKTSPDKDSGPLQENLDVSIIGSSQPTLPKNNVYRRRRSKRKSHSHDVLSKLKPIDVNRLSKWEDCNDSELEILNFKFKMPQPNFEMISQQSEFTLPKEFTRFKLECKRTRTVLNLEDDIDLEILSQSIFKSKRRRKSSWNPSEDDTVILANVEKETVAMMTENPDSVPINPILLDIETSYCPSGINVVTSDSDSTLPFNSVKKQDGLSKEAGNDLLVNESENDGKLADLNDFEISKNSEIAKPSRDEKVDFQFDEKRLTQQQQTSSSINLEEWSENFSHEILPVEMKSSLKNGCFVSVTEDQCVFHSNQGEEELLLKLHRLELVT